MKVKEMYHTEFIDKDMNEWIEENPNVKIIDIKYSASESHSSVLIIYEEEIRNGR